MMPINLMKRFQWTEDSLTLRQFVDHYSHRLPQIVNVSDGYAGRDEEMHQFSSDEIYWVRQIERQPRVILCDAKKRYLSVPYSYKGTFQVHDVTGKISVSMTLKEAVAQCQGPRDRILFSQNEPIFFHKGAACGDVERVGLLRLHDVYEQKYLIAHSLITDEVMPQAVLIPVYVPIEVIVAHGLTDGTPVNFALFNTSIRKYVTKYKMKEFKVERDILMFNEVPGEEYDYIFPSTDALTTEPAPALALAPASPGAPPLPPPRPPCDGDDDVVDEKNLIDIPDDPFMWRMPKGKKLFFPPPPPPADDDDDDGDYEMFDNVRNLTKLDKMAPSFEVYRLKAAVMEELQKKPVQLDASAISHIVEVAIKTIQQQQNTVSTPPPLPNRPPKSAKEIARVTPNVHPAASSPDQTAPIADAAVSAAPVVGLARRSTVRPPDVAPKPSRPMKRNQSAKAAVPVWTSGSQIPLDIESFSVPQVGQSLRLIGMGKHADKMAQEGIDGSLLASLEEELFVSELGFNKFEARKITQFVHHKWRPKD